MGPMVAQSGSNVRIQNTFNIFLVADAISEKAIAQIESETADETPNRKPALRMVLPIVPHDSSPKSSERATETAPTEKASTGGTAAAVNAVKTTRPTPTVPEDKSTSAPIAATTAITAPERLSSRSSDPQSSTSEHEFDLEDVENNYEDN